MGKLDGIVSITGLPPHRGLIVNLCFFEVSGPDAPAPYNGDPPTEAATDLHTVVEDVHLKEESRRFNCNHPFSIEHRPGYFYVQVRAILFREHNGAMLAQAEQFFYSRRPLKITAEAEGHVTLPVSWPSVPLEELHHSGTISPRKTESD